MTTGTPHRRPPSARRRSGSGDSDQRDRWLISYADLVTLLFSLFVVLYAATDRDRARAVAEATRQQSSHSQSSPAASTEGAGVLPGADARTRDEALLSTSARAAVDRAFAAHGALRARARVSSTERGLVVSLAEAGFFAPGEAAVRDDAGELIDALADALLKERALLRVEGHTDSTPISTARYPSNWELSSARASAVLARLVARGLEPARLSVAGYAGERPIADNSEPSGRALNRRVDLVILQMKH
jgi:chemotaxis protein MotB